MSQEEDLFAYDEDDAVRYILNVLPQELKEKRFALEALLIFQLVHDHLTAVGRSCTNC